VLLDYGKHQRRLLPLLAQNYAQFFAHDELLRKFDGVFSGRTDTPQEREDLETLAAALKPLSTWNALSTVQEAARRAAARASCREPHGGPAPTSTSTSPSRATTTSCCSWSASACSPTMRQFKGADAAKLAKFAAKQTAGKVFHGAGLRQFGQAVADLGSTARSVELGCAPSSSTSCSRARRADDLRHRGRLRPRKATGARRRLFNANQAELIEAARAHGELLQWEAFSDGVAKVEDAGTAQVLTWLRDLFGMHLIEKHLAWYLINGRLSAQRAASVSRYIDRLALRLRPRAGPRGCLRLRPRARARTHRLGRRTGAPGRGARVLRRPRRLGRRARLGEVARQEEVAPART
jgi:acyl-CoA oxidase